MAKVILQMQCSVDGLVSAKRDHPWTVWDWAYPSTWDSRLLAEFNATLSGVGTILLSRPMAEGGYVDHWTAMYKDHGHEPGYAFLRAVVDAEKVIVTNKPIDVRWSNTRAAAGVLENVVSEIVEQAERDVICFGGAGFARALLERGMVDELQLYINPALVGEGRSISENLGHRRLAMISSKSYETGIVVSKYAIVGTRSSGEPGNELGAPEGHRL